MRRPWGTLGIVVLGLVFAFAAPPGAAYQEAPMLTELVEAGELLPLEDRLPKEPLVIEPYHEIGQYGGGTWYRLSTDDGWANIRMAMYGHSPVRWVDDALDIAPNWISSWEYNEDMNHYTLYVREGIRWSDGEPFTTADFMFWWEDMVLNEEMSDPVPDMLTARGEVAEITTPDEYTIDIRFADTSPFLMQRMAMWVNAGIGERWLAPAHYLKQYHPDYSDEYDDFEVFEERMEWWINVDAPVLTEWMPVEHDVASRLVLERNPYYYAVDPEGNQLPYVDRIVVEFREDNESLVLGILGGQTDMQLRPTQPETNFQMIIDGQEEGGYRVHYWEAGDGTGLGPFPNWNHPDPNKRELYRMPEFRQAVSHSFNRERMQAMVYFGMGDPTTGTHSPKSSEFHRTEEAWDKFIAWRDAYLFDPERAEELLDSIGVVDENGDGWRQMPNGDELELRFDYNAEASSDYIQLNEMMQADLADVGLKVELNPMDGASLDVLTNDEVAFDWHTSWGAADGPNFWVFPQWLVPIDRSRWAPLYGSWYQQLQAGRAHEEADEDPRDRTPPRKEPAEDDPVRKLWEIYDKARYEADEAKRDEYAFQIVDIHMEYGPFFLGTVHNREHVVVVSERMRNVPDREDLALGGFINPWITPYEAMAKPVQYFFVE